MKKTPMALRALALAATFALAACGGGGGGGGGFLPFVAPVARATPAAPAFTIGGTLAGLGGGTLVLRNNGGDDLSLTADGAFRFPRAVAQGGSYDVRVFTQPAGQVCTVSQGQGTATAAVADIAVGCVADTASMLPAIPGTPTLAYAPRSFAFQWGAAGNASYYRLGSQAGSGGSFAVLVDNLAGTTHTLQDTSVLAFAPGATPLYAVQACNAAGCSPWSLPVQADPLRAIGFLKASNARAGNRFGHNVALSRDGRTLLVNADAEASAAAGVNGDQSDTSAPAAGAVYVFTRVNGEWVQQAYLKPSNTDAGDGFGNQAMALSEDGNTIAVGAVGESSAATGINGPEGDNSAPSAGAVYVFTRDPAGTWTQQAYVKASNAQAGDNFGRAVTLSGDGNVLAVGASEESSSATGVGGNQADNTMAGAGAAYVFRRAGTSWAQEAYVKASNTSGNVYFGSALSLSLDGRTLAAGAFIDGTRGFSAGAVHVFADGGVGAWSHQALIFGSNTESPDRFGVAVALSGDGNVLAVGADRESGNGSDPLDNSLGDAGAVYTYTRTGTVWFPQSYIKAPVPGSGDSFGASLSLSTDGTVLAVSAYGERSASGMDGDAADDSISANGAAYLFKRDSGSWAAVRYIKPFVANILQQFGTAVSLSGDGRTLAIGSQGDDSSATGVGGDWATLGAGNSGAVYLY